MSRGEVRECRKHQGQDPCDQKAEDFREAVVGRERGNFARVKRAAVAGFCERKFASFAPNESLGLIVKKLKNCLNF